MKHLITIGLLLVAFLAQAQLGDCVIFSPDDELFHVAIDNKFQNAEATSNIKIKNVPEGDYWVTILFADKDKKGIKTTLQMRGTNEISFKLDKGESGWKLKQYSNIPLSQAKMVESNQFVQYYDEKGVEVRGVKNANQLSQDVVEGSEDLNMIQGDIESKRMGKFKVTEKETTDNTAPAATQPETPETGTTIVSEYIKVENADGTTSIVEQKTTTYKEVVERNGQKFLKKKSNKAQYPTDFNCLPLNKDKFLALKDKVSSSTDKLSVAMAGIKDQCMTPAQLEVIGNLLPKNQLNDFAMEARSTCANPKKFPFTIEEPVVAVEENPVKEEVVEEEVVTEAEVVEKEEDTNPKLVEAEIMTKAELKAALKAEKARVRAEKKAARKKAKAERKAARAAAKAARKKK